MFTVRVQPKQAHPDEWSGHEAESYKVVRNAGGVHLTLYKPDEGPVEIDLNEEGVIYIMNDRGTTVETIRQRSRKVREEMVKQGIDPITPANAGGDPEMERSLKTS